MKRGTPRHPKVAHLRQLLKVGLATAVGYLELLWHFTAEFAPRGDIGRFGDERIEAAMDWHGRPGRLLSAMIESGWIDHHSECRLYVHDWSDHADDAVKKRLLRTGVKFVGVSVKLTGHCPSSDRDSADTVRQSPDMERLPEPTPEPEPTPPPVQLSEYPLSAAAVRRRFATADLIIVGRIVDACARAYLSIDQPLIPEPSDADYAAAIDRAADETPAQAGAGLFLRTAPAVIESWAKYGKDAPKRSNGRQAAINAEWEAISNGNR